MAYGEGRCPESGGSNRWYSLVQPERVVVNLANNGTWQGKSGFGGFFGYGEEDTGLEHVGHRCYDPTTGRILTRDPAYDGPNWYAYCLGDPVNMADPTGLIPLETIADVAGIGMDIADICQNPKNGWAWGGLVWSLAATVIPYAPGSWVKRTVTGAEKIAESARRGREAEELVEQVAKREGRDFRRVYHYEKTSEGRRKHDFHE